MKRVDVKQTGPAIQKGLSLEKPGPILIMRGRKPFAAILPLDGGDYESIALSLSPKLWDILKRSRERLKAEGGIPLEEIEREFGLAPD